MWAIIFSCLLALLCLVTDANAASVLGLFPFISKSHFAYHHAILKSLHSAGHRITMITPFRPEKEIENFTYIVPPVSKYSSVHRVRIDEWIDASLSNLLYVFSYSASEECNNVLNTPEIQDALHSSEKLYDIVLAQCSLDFDCYVPIAQKLDIPIIASVTFRVIERADQAIGVLNNPAVVPTSYGGTSNIEMNLVERMENLWKSFVINYYFKYAGWHIREVYQKYSNFDTISPKKKHVSLVFYNNHASLFPRPYVPNAIDIGGIHINPAKPLPKNIQKFVDEAPHGVILFTLGSVVKSSSMSVEQTAAFLSAFASIPQRVLWKYEESIKNLPENIMISSWLPQRDILEHKNVIAFMSHGGISGIYEAILTGTPVVAIPLFGDQSTNAALLRYRGIGVNLDYKNVTKESVLAALNAVINDTNYYQRMQKFSRLFKDNPMTPQESVVYWTEYVIRHNGASHLRAIGTDLPFYQYFMLDIIAVVLLVTSLVIFVIYAIVRKIYRLVMGKSRYVSSVKKDD